MRFGWGAAVEDVDVCAFGGEDVGCCEADAGGAACVGVELVMRCEDWDCALRWWFQRTGKV